MNRALRKFLSAEHVKRLTQEPSEPLYHYTSFVGLVGIVDSGELWATASTHLNDPLEREYARTMLDAALRTRQGDAAKQLLYCFQRDIHGESGFTAYFFSLSGQRDSLPQWNSYCSTGGVAIGIAPEHLSTLRREKKGRILRCVYDRKDQQEILGTMLDSFEKEFESIRRVRPKARRLDLTDHLTSEFTIAFMVVSMAFKDQAYSHEDEWRLVTVLAEGSPRNDALRFRPSRFGVSPIMPMGLEDEDHPRDWIRTVVVGNHPFYKEAAHGIKMLLEHWRSDGVVVPTGVTHR